MVQLRLRYLRCGHVSSACSQGSQLCFPGTQLFASLYWFSQGRLVVHAGTEGFQSEMGPWSVLGTKALGSEPYFPDFDAFSSGGCRLMRIHAEAYRSALRMGKADRIVGVRAMRQLSQVCACDCCAELQGPEQASGHVLQQLTWHGMHSLPWKALSPICMLDRTLGRIAVMECDKDGEIAVPSSLVLLFCFASKILHLLWSYRQWIL